MTTTDLAQAGERPTPPPVVKAFGGSERAHRSFLSAVDDFVGVFFRWVRGMSVIAAGMQLALSPPFVLLVVLTGGATLITSGGLAPADLLPFLLLGLGLTAPVAALGHGFDDMQAARRAVGRIREVLAVRPLPEPAHLVAPQGHRVELRDVRFGYQRGEHELTRTTEPIELVDERRSREEHEPDHEVLRGIDLVLEPGTVTAVAGAAARIRDGDRPGRPAVGWRGAADLDRTRAAGRRARSGA
ncbi:hypothetical protein ACFHYQ_19890 [Sphaerimonospora cavernae]|uniref:ABC transmembrane type-1 domain-containing protein n=1 Tax=Sphaerimonospora cavernae TaxID=1740611 RepID=A0ABV6U821_9ACTN